MSLAAGTHLGPYEIVALVGEGGMGVVYRARDPRLDRHVAVKVLPPEFAVDPDRLRRFEQEARAASALNHPNILVVHDIGSHDGAPYLVSELLEGESLRSRLQGGSLPPRRVVELAAQVCSGLAAAHEKGIVHRDLKPENLFITSDGHVKILAGWHLGGGERRRLPGVTKPAFPIRCRPTGERCSLRRALSQSQLSASTWPAASEASSGSWCPRIRWRE